MESLTIRFEHGKLLFSIFERLNVNSMMNYNLKKITQIYRSSVVRWHSFQNGERPNLIFKKGATKAHELFYSDGGMSLASMSCGQLQVSISRIFLSFLRFIQEMMRELPENRGYFTRFRRN